MVEPPIGKMKLIFDPFATYFLILPLIYFAELTLAVVAEEPRINRLLFVTIFPELKAKVPLMVAFTLPPRESPDELSSVRLLNVVAADPVMDWAELPEKVTVPEEALTVPLFVQVPRTVIDAGRVLVPAPLKVMF